MLQTLRTLATLMENLNLIQLQGILSPLAWGGGGACTHMQIPHTQKTHIQLKLKLKKIHMHEHILNFFK